MATLQWQVLGMVMLFGALGGFVDGLTTDIPYKVSWGGRHFDIGSAGDALVGMTSAVAIFTVATALFPDLEIERFDSSPTAFIRIVALGVLSGYAGIRLLNPLTRKLAEQIATEKAADAVKDVQVRNTELAINVKDAERKVIEFDLRRTELLAQGQHEAAAKLLDEARTRYDAALAVERHDTEALLGLARVARRQAELAQLRQRDPAPHWAEALRALDAITMRDRSAARAFYNKACYKALKGDSAAVALADLQQALELAPALKPRARSDPDFGVLAALPDFLRLVA